MEKLIADQREDRNEVKSLHDELRSVFNLSKPKEEKPKEEETIHVEDTTVDPTVKEFQGQGELDIVMSS